MISVRNTAQAMVDEFRSQYEFMHRVTSSPEPFRFLFHESGVLNNPAYFDPEGGPVSRFYQEVIYMLDIWNNTGVEPRKQGQVKLA